MRTFKSHRAGLDKLVSMATHDPWLRRIDGGEITPDDMAVERYREYRALFRELGIKNSLTWRLVPGTGGLFIIAESWIPLGGRGASVGYVYSEGQLTPVVSHLEVPNLLAEIHRGTGSRSVYQRLEDHWYLYYESTW